MLMMLMILLQSIQHILVITSFSVFQAECFPTQKLHNTNNIHFLSKRQPVIISSINKKPERYTEKTASQLYWLFGSGEKKENEKENDSDSPSYQKKVTRRPSMGETANIMENFKQNQELGKKTNALLQDLQSFSVDGVAATGKIKVLFDAQQRPIGVDIDEDYLRNVNVDDLNENLLVALQDGHKKSMQIMQEKMFSLYDDFFK